MAETSGFMTDLPQSSYLSLSIKRAISTAQQRSHQYVTLEHLLLALLDDPNTVEILEGLQADIPSIQHGIGDIVNRKLTSLYTPGEFDLHASYKVERVLQSASDDADRLSCDEVDAAFVLAAIARETDNHAGRLLKENGVAYTSAVTWLYANRGISTAMRSSRPKPQKAPPVEERPAPAPMPALEPEPEPQAASEPAAFSPEPLQEYTPPSAPVDRAPPPAAPIEGATALAQEQFEPQEWSDNAAEDQLTTPQKSDDASLLELEFVEEEEPLQPPPNWLRQNPGDNAAERNTPPPRPAPKGPPPPPMPAPSPAPTAPPFPSQNRYGDAEPAIRDSRDNRENVAPSLAPSPPPRRPEPQVPSSSRLNEMRVRSASSPPPAVTTSKGRAPMPAPAPSSGTQKSKKQRPHPRNAPPKNAERANLPAERPRSARQAGRRKSRPIDVAIGRLIENIPRRMKAEVAERIEVRISQDDTKLLSRGMEGRGEPVRHEVMLTQTMSVALRAPDGGFTIEPLSPETQWIFDRPDSKELYGRWRWAVTPHRAGSRRLQLIIAARSVGQNGLVGDSALPDQVINIRVRTNYWRVVGYGIQWAVAMVVGGVLSQLALIGLNMLD